MKIELSADLATQAQELANRAEALAHEIAPFTMPSVRPTMSRYVEPGFRCLTAIDWARQAATELRNTAADLHRISATTAPGTSDPVGHMSRPRQHAD